MLAVVHSQCQQDDMYPMLFNPGLPAGRSSGLETHPSSCRSHSCKSQDKHSK
jgi:hypothetical protein